MIKKNRIEDQWRDDDGYWIALKSGWQDSETPQCHTIVEGTRREAFQHKVIACDCKDCKADITRWVHSTIPK